MFASSSVSWFNIAMGLAGGMALFLFGMEQMTDSLKGFAGGRMKQLLARVTSNRFWAVSAGAFVTAVIQSSSVTTVLVIGFISAGLMTLPQSIGVIMGANIGTTITAQLIAFQITHYALLLVAVGFSMMFFSKNERVQQYGPVFMGLGLLLFGMDLMSTATHPLRSYAPFIRLMKQMEHPMLGLLLGMMFTAIVQSSSATTGVVIVLAGQGFISLEAGIALCLGANVGTCVTAVIASIGKQREAVQAAMVHILFNMAGVLIWFGLLEQLAVVVRWISPSVDNLQGVAKLAAETPRQIANAHTLFNVANTLLLIGLTSPIAWVVDKITPLGWEKKAAPVQPKYLDVLLLETPALALDRVRMEMQRLGERAHDMVMRALPTVFRGSRQELENLSRKDDEIDFLHGAVVTYLGQLLKKNLKEEQSRQLRLYMNVANYLESIGDLIETNIVSAGLERLKSNIHVSEPTQAVLQALHTEVCNQVQLALQALDSTDIATANVVLEAKTKINLLAEQAERHLALRLIAEEEDRLALFRMESEIIDYLKQVYYFANRIAKGVREWQEKPGLVSQETEKGP